MKKQTDLTEYLLKNKITKIPEGAHTERIPLREYRKTAFKGQGEARTDQPASLPWFLNLYEAFKVSGDSFNVTVGGAYAEVRNSHQRYIILLGKTEAQCNYFRKRHWTVLNIEPYDDTQFFQMMLGLEEYREDFEADDESRLDPWKGKLWK